MKLFNFSSAFSIWPIVKTYWESEILIFLNSLAPSFFNFWTFVSFSGVTWLPISESEFHLVRFGFRNQASMNQDYGHILKKFKIFRVTPSWSMDPRYASDLGWLRVVQSILFWNRCRKEADPTYYDSGFESSIDFESI